MLRAQSRQIVVGCGLGVDWVCAECLSSVCCMWTGPELGVDWI